MSCSWDVYCVDCNENTYLENSNHREDFCTWLVANAVTLQSMVAMFRTSPWSDAELKLDYIRVPLDFFEKHGGHRLLAQDEYGAFSGKCGVRFKCPGGCGHASPCALPKDHEGDHGATP